MGMIARLLSGFRTELILSAIAALIITVLAFQLQAARVENLTVERDQALAATTLAEAKLEAYRRVKLAEVAALEKARSDYEQQQRFFKDNSKRIEQGRATGDGPLAPLARDTAARLRDRLQARAGGNRNP